MARTADGVDLAVIGLGYVGLPLAQAAVAAGLRVAGIDLDSAKVEGLRAGRSHVDDLADADVTAMLDDGFAPTTDPSVLAGADACTICVPTPLTSTGMPDLAAVESAVAAVADHLHPGMLVVLESTTYPGTTEDVVRPRLEKSGLVAGRDFHLAYSPERVDPGNPTWGIRNTPKVVGGCTDACTEAAAALYGRFVEHVVRTRGTREAELAKLLENTYRHVNIALVNEMAIFTHDLGIDLWDAIDAAATKPFGFHAFRPGPGVGGHCIPIDPNYLSYTVRTLGYPFRFVELAQEINARMPAYVAVRAQRALNDAGKAVRGSRILLLGVSYKADIADERETPARPLARQLLSLGGDVRWHDPGVSGFAVDGRALSTGDLQDEVARADLVIVLQPHGAYALDEVAAAAQRVLDTRGVLRGANVERL